LIEIYIGLGYHKKQHSLFLLACLILY